MRKPNHTEIVEEITEDLICEITALEHSLFHESFHTSEAEIHEAMHEPSAITVAAYDDEGKLAGYLLAIDLKEEADDLRESVDPKVEDIPGALYIHSIGIRQDMQGKGYFSKLVKKYLEQYPDKTTALHASTANSCSAGMQKYGARFIHRVENWYDTGEPYDYLLFEPRKQPEN
jgi:GNAT superfamily N-acetyltransferase